MEKEYFKISNYNETLYFNINTLTKNDIICFENSGYKVETIKTKYRLLRKTIIESLKRLNELKGN